MSRIVAPIKGLTPLGIGAAPSDGRIVVAAANGTGGLDTAKVADAIALAKSRGGRQCIQLQPGIYSVNPASLLFDTNNVMFVGAGMGVTEIAKTGAGDLITIAPPTGDASVIERVFIRDMRLNGKDFTGTLVSHRFASQCHVQDVEFGYNQGIGLDMIRPWDTVVDSCLFDHVGPNDGSAASVHVRNSGATTGALLSAAGQANMITFRSCRIESMKRAIVIERGPGNTADPYGIYFHGLKVETYFARGTMVSVVNVRGISFRDVDMSMLGLDAGAAAGIGIEWAPLFRSKLDSIRFYCNASIITRGINSWIPGGSHEICNVASESAACTQALIWHNTTGALDRRGITAAAGVVQGGSVPAASP